MVCFNDATAFHTRESGFRQKPDSLIFKRNFETNDLLAQTHQTIAFRKMPDDFPS